MSPVQVPRGGSGFAVDEHAFRKQRTNDDVDGVGVHVVSGEHDGHGCAADELLARGCAREYPKRGICAAPEGRRREERRRCVREVGQAQAAPDLDRVGLCGVPLRPGRTRVCVPQMGIAYGRSG